MLPSQTNHVSYVFFPPSNKDLISEAHGKWIIHCKKKQLDAVYVFLQPFITKHPLLLLMKASTMKPNAYASHPQNGVIMIYLPFVPHQDTIQQTGQYLIDSFMSRSFCFSPFSNIHYKTELQSKQGARASGVVENNTLLSLPLPKQLVMDREDEAKELLTQKQNQAVIDEATMNHLGAIWNTSLNQWCAPNDSVMLKMMNYIKPEREQTHEQTLSILSMNLCSKPHDVKIRTQGILDALETHQPDILCLQEVNYANWSYLHLALLQIGYNTRCDCEFHKDNTLFCEMLYYHTATIQPNRFETFPIVDTICKKKLQLLTFTHKSSHRDFTTATFHLPTGAKEAKLRMQLLSAVFDHVRAQMLPWCVAGDTNISYYQEEELAIKLPAFIYDAWEAAGSNTETKVTYDIQKNSHLAHIPRHVPGCRFDRVFYDRCGMVVSNFKLVCTSKLESGMHPSDHYGVLSEFFI